jgi:hypothetical protein
MILVTSAAYVNAEFQGEFGELPPAFLPVGNQRLYRRQIDVLHRRFPGERIFVSIPESFRIGSSDRRFFEERRITLLYLNEHMALGESIRRAAEAGLASDSELRILHGDTLVSDPPADLDALGLGRSEENYNWERSRLHGKDAIWCGYFSFADGRLLADLLKENSFVLAVRKYDAQREMRKFVLDGWLDFGHVNTFYKSRSRLTTERAFNALAIDDGVCRKMGDDPRKIAAEIEWYQAVPPDLRIYCPQLLDHGVDGLSRTWYATEYLAIPPLNEMYVFGRNPPNFWGKVFDIIARLLSVCRDAVPPCELAQCRVSARELIRGKTLRRLESFFEQNPALSLRTTPVLNGDVLPDLEAIAHDCMAVVDSGRPMPGIVHGDLCFSNILYDSRSDRIKIVDPRGRGGFDENTIYGDLRYDLAKLAHSVIGLYDFIIAGAYDLRQRHAQGRWEAEISFFLTDAQRRVQEGFLGHALLQGVPRKEVAALAVILFLSMLPLHADDPQRQLALLAAGLRVYRNFLLRQSDDSHSDDGKEPAFL